jgi:DNA replicative helicase MCM subunit Mcm2 (Cdc46/Mcm family)
MKKLQKSLKAVHRDLNALAKTVNRLIVAVEKIDKATSLKKTAAKAAAVKKTAPKRVKKVTAADTVLGYIKRSKKGIDTATLMKKTGFNQKKIHNIIFKLKNQGNIKSKAKGVYLKA